MDMVFCSRCGSDEHVKNGVVGRAQRYRCKPCGYNFRMVPRRGMHPGLKALAVVLNSVGRMSYGMIGKVFGVSGVAVYKWVRAAGEAAPLPHIPTELHDIQIDEMHHFLASKKTRGGYGKRMRLIFVEPSPGKWVAVIHPLSTGSGRE